LQKIITEDITDAIDLFSNGLIAEGLKQARKNVGANSCWDDYEADGTKMKDGVEVPNCVPVGESEDSDEFESHMMYNPKNGKGYKAETLEDHLRMKKLGYSHEKPKKY